MPQKTTRAVAKRKLVAKGAKTIAPAKSTCPTTQIVRSSGLILSSPSTSLAMLLGGRAVNPSSSGACTNSGSSHAPVKVMTE